MAAVPHDPCRAGSSVVPRPHVVPAAWGEHMNPITWSHPRVARRPRGTGAMIGLWRFGGSRELAACGRNDAYTGEIDVVAAESRDPTAVARHILALEEAVK